MFFVRPATVDDLPALLKLAKMVHFINLPADTEILRQKIVRSRKSFAGEAATPREREFVFVMETTETDNVVGTSSIISCVSWPGRPHTFMQVRKREHYSTDLQTGQVHMTLQLGTDETGPSEIGGLVLGPSFRGHQEKLGLMLSLVRFHFIGGHRQWFADRILAEMMGPLTPDSRNEFWEHFGRRFINLSFAEADLFCQLSKEFITSLLPKEEIYVSLLPPAARNAIARVGADTEPALHLLESVGFRYNEHIDPFDGGPYLEALVDEIELVRQTKTMTVGKAAAKEREQMGIVSVNRGHEFRAVRVAYAESGGKISIDPEAAEVIGAKPGDEVWVTPLPAPSDEPPRRTRKSKQSASARAAAPPEAVT